MRNLFPQMESVTRISGIPVVENSLKMSGKLYSKLKVFFSLDGRMKIMFLFAIISIYIHILNAKHWNVPET